MKVWILHFWILILCIGYGNSNHLSQNSTISRDEFQRSRNRVRNPVIDNRIPNTNSLNGRASNRNNAANINRVILTPVQDGAVRSLRTLLSNGRGRANPRLIGFLIPRPDGRTQLRLMRGAMNFLSPEGLQQLRMRGNAAARNGQGLPFDLRTIIDAARRANLLPRNGTAAQRNSNPPIVVLRSSQNNRGSRQSLNSLGGNRQRDSGQGFNNFNDRRTLQRQLSARGITPVRNRNQESDTTERKVNVDININAPDSNDLNTGNDVLGRSRLGGVTRQRQGIPMSNSRSNLVQGREDNLASFNRRLQRINNSLQRRQNLFGNNNGVRRQGLGSDLPRGLSTISSRNDNFDTTNLNQASRMTPDTNSQRDMNLASDTQSISGQPPPLRRFDQQERFPSLNSFSNGGFGQRSNNPSESNGGFGTSAGGSSKFAGTIRRTRNRPTDNTDSPGSPNNAINRNSNQIINNQNTIVSQNTVPTFNAIANPNMINKQNSNSIRPLNLNNQQNTLQSLNARNNVGKLNSGKQLVTNNQNINTINMINQSPKQTDQTQSSVNIQNTLFGSQGKINQNTNQTPLSPFISNANQVNNLPRNRASLPTGGIPNNSGNNQLGISSAAPNTLITTKRGIPGVQFPKKNSNSVSGFNQQSMGPSNQPIGRRLGFQNSQQQPQVLDNSPAMIQPIFNPSFFSSQQVNRINQQGTQTSISNGITQQVPRNTGFQTGSQQMNLQRQNQDLAAASLLLGAMSSTQKQPFTSLVNQGHHTIGNTGAIQHTNSLMHTMSVNQNNGVLSNGKGEIQQANINSLAAQTGPIAQNIAGMSKEQKDTSVKSKKLKPGVLRSRTNEENSKTSNLTFGIDQNLINSNNGLKRNPIGASSVTNKDSLGVNQVNPTPSSTISTGTSSGLGLNLNQITSPISNTMSELNLKEMNSVIANEASSLLLNRMNSGIKSDALGVNLNKNSQTATKGIVGTDMGKVDNAVTNNALGLGLNGVNAAGESQQSFDMGHNPMNNEIRSAMFGLGLDNLNNENNNEALDLNMNLMGSRMNDKPLEINPNEIKSEISLSQNKEDLAQQDSLFGLNIDNFNQPMTNEALDRTLNNMSPSQRKALLGIRQNELNSIVNNEKLRSDLSKLVTGRGMSSINTLNKTNNKLNPRNSRRLSGAERRFMSQLLSLPSPMSNLLKSALAIRKMNNAAALKPNLNSNLNSMKPTQKADLTFVQNQAKPLNTSSKIKNLTRKTTKETSSKSAVVRSDRRKTKIKSNRDKNKRKLRNRGGVTGPSSTQSIARNENNANSGHSRKNINPPKIIPRFKTTIESTSFAQPLGQTQSMPARSIDTSMELNASQQKRDKFNPPMLDRMTEPTVSADQLALQALQREQKVLEQLVAKLVLQEQRNRQSASQAPLPRRELDPVVSRTTTNAQFVEEPVSFAPPDGGMQTPIGAQEPQNQVVLPTPPPFESGVPLDPPNQPASVDQFLTSSVSSMSLSHASNEHNSIHPMNDIRDIQNQLDLGLPSPFVDELKIPPVINTPNSNQSPLNSNIGSKSTPREIKRIITMAPTVPTTTTTQTPTTTTTTQTPTTTTTTPTTTTTATTTTTQPEIQTPLIVKVPAFQNPDHIALAEHSRMSNENAQSHISSVSSQHNSQAMLQFQHRDNSNSNIQNEWASGTVKETKTQFSNIQKSDNLPPRVEPQGVPLQRQDNSNITPDVQTDLFDLRRALRNEESNIDILPPSNDFMEVPIPFAKVQTCVRDKPKHWSPEVRKLSDIVDAECSCLCVGASQSGRMMNNDLRLDIQSHQASGHGEHHNLNIPHIKTDPVMESPSPKTTTASIVASMDVHSLRSLISEVLNNFFKNHQIDPAAVAKEVSKNSTVAMDYVGQAVVESSLRNRMREKQMSTNGSLNITTDAIQSPPSLPVQLNSTVAESIVVLNNITDIVTSAPLNTTTVNSSQVVGQTIVNSPSLIESTTMAVVTSTASSATSISPVNTNVTDVVLNSTKVMVSLVNPVDVSSAQPQPPQEITTPPSPSSIISTLSTIPVTASVPLAHSSTPITTIVSNTVGMAEVNVTVVSSTLPSPVYIQTAAPGNKVADLAIPPDPSLNLPNPNANVPVDNFAHDNTATMSINEQNTFSSELGNFGTAVESQGHNVHQTSSSIPITSDFHGNSFHQSSPDFSTSSHDIVSSPADIVSSISNNNMHSSSNNIDAGNSWHSPITQGNSVTSQLSNNFPFISSNALEANSNNMQVNPNQSNLFSNLFEIPNVTTRRNSQNGAAVIVDNLSNSISMQPRVPAASTPWDQGGSSLANLVRETQGFMNPSNNIGNVTTSSPYVPTPVPSTPQTSVLMSPLPAPSTLSSSTLTSTSSIPPTISLSSPVGSSTPPSPKERSPIPPTISLSFPMEPTTTLSRTEGNPIPSAIRLSSPTGSTNTTSTTGRGLLTSTSTIPLTISLSSPVEPTTTPSPTEKNPYDFLPPIIIVETDPPNP